MSQPWSGNHLGRQQRSIPWVDGSEKPLFRVRVAINLKISPLQFSGIATRSLEVDESLAILREIGFDDVPIRLRDKAALRAELMYSFDADMRLNPEQLELFKLQMRGLHL